MADGPNFDGNTPVAGYTLFKGKDGNNFYLKGENLEPDDVQQRVAKLRGSAATIPGAPNGLPKVPSGVVGNPQAAAATMQPSNLGTIATGPPLMSMQPGLPAPAQVPENAERMSQGAAIGAPIGGLIAGGVAAAPAIGRTLLGAAGGSALGGYGGREIGGILGNPALGGQIGATVGGLAGGVAGARGVNVPAGRAGLLEKLFATETPVEPVNPLKEAVARREAAYLPVRMKAIKPVAAPAPSPFPAEATSSSSVQGNAQLPPAPTTPQPQMGMVTKLAKTKAPIVDVTEPNASAQDLITRMKKLVIPGEQPTAADLKRAGDLTQAPLPVLKNLKKFGDKLAANEIDRRLRQGLIK